MRPDRKRGKRGFTLLEALVAVAVVGFLFVPALQSLVTSTSMSRAAARQMAARLVIDRLLASIPPGRGEQIARRTGTDGGFAWTMDATPQSLASSAPTDDTTPVYMTWRVSITLTGGGAPISVETARLGPAPPPPETGNE